MNECQILVHSVYSQPAIAVGRVSHFLQTGQIHLVSFAESRWYLGLDAGKMRQNGFTGGFSLRNHWLQWTQNSPPHRITLFCDTLPERLATTPKICFWLECPSWSSSIYGGAFLIISIRSFLLMTSMATTNDETMLLNKWTDIKRGTLVDKRLV